MNTGQKVLMEIDDNILQIVGNLQGILDQQLNPRPMHLLNIFINIILIILFFFDCGLSHLEVDKDS